MSIINYLKRCLRLVLSQPYRMGLVTVLSMAKEWTTKNRVSSTAGSIDISIDVFCATSKPKKQKPLSFGDNLVNLIYTKMKERPNSTIFCKTFLAM